MEMESNCGWNWGGYRSQLSFSLHCLISYSAINTAITWFFLGIVILCNTTETCNMFGLVYHISCNNFGEFCRDSIKTLKTLALNFKF